MYNTDAQQCRSPRPFPMIPLRMHSVLFPMAETSWGLPSHTTWPPHSLLWNVPHPLDKPRQPQKNIFSSGPANTSPAQSPLNPTSKIHLNHPLKWKLLLPFPSIPPTHTLPHPAQAWDQERVDSSRPAAQSPRRHLLKAIPASSNRTTPLTAQSTTSTFPLAHTLIKRHSRLTPEHWVQQKQHACKLSTPV
jgi:hypothetical protein